MAKIRKAVFRSGIVMMSLLAAIVLSSSVAHAQECVACSAKVNPTDARAEGMNRSDGGHRTCGACARIASAKFGVQQPLTRHLIL